MTLIEKLEQLSNKYFNQCAYHGDNADLNYGFAIDEAIDIVKQHQAESDWISVDERLPEHDKPVLVWVVSKIGNAYAFKAYYENSWHLDFGEITHWQPLPQPPK